MKKIAVTGGSGKLGRKVVQELLAHGFKVTNLDLFQTPEAACHTQQVDLCDLGTTVDAISGHDAVIHLAAICQARVVPPADTFRANLLSTFNVFHAAKLLGIGRVVWASSETTLGLPWSKQTPPRYVPVDEDHFPHPTTHYGLSKHLGEVIADWYAQREPMSFVGLRFSNIMDVQDYAAFPGYSNDPLERVWNLWAYIDSRDAAQACRLALTAEIAGSENFIISSPDTVMTRPTMELLREVFPDVEVRSPLQGFDTPLVNDKARRLLGYNPQHSWRDHANKNS